MRRSASAIAACASIALAAARGGALGSRRASRAAAAGGGGARRALAAADGLAVRLAARLLRDAGPLRERRPVERPRRRRPASRSRTGYDPAEHRLVPRRRLQGAHRHAATTRARASRGSRRSASPRSGSRPPVGQQTVQGDSAAYHGYWGLDFTRVDPHLGTERGLHGVRRLRALARAEGLPRRRRQPHGGRDHSVGGSGYVGPEEVPYRDCKGKPFVAARYAGGTTLPVPRAQVHAADPVRAAGRPQGEEPGLAERRPCATTTAGTSTSPAAAPPASSRATSSGSTTSSPSSRSW